jgi:carbon starvation protein CstA
MNSLIIACGAEIGLGQENNGTILQGAEAFNQQYASWSAAGGGNQLPGDLALLVITVWLARKKINIAYTALPMIFMLVMTSWAMKINLEIFYAQSK